MAAILLSAATSADASSIFFIRDGNIWAAAPDGSRAVAVTTDGTPSSPYDFVASAKTAPVLAFHRGGNSGSQFGSLKPDGTGITVNPDNASMEVANQFFTHLDAAGDRMTWAQKRHTSDLQYFAASVGLDASAPQEIYHAASTMDARNVTFGDPAGSSLLFTDVGTNYAIAGSEVCDATDSYTDVLVLQTPAALGSGAAPDPTAVYCADNTILSAPALSPDGSTIAAEADSTTAGSSGQIVTIPIGGGVASASAQSPLTPLTPANSGDTLPDFSPDGSQIVFQGPGNTIDTVSTAGGPATQILTNASVPAWSPYTLPASGAPGSATGSPGPGATSPPTSRHCTVPKLAGRSIAASRTALARAHCRLGRHPTAYAAHTRRGHVISQSPRAGRVLAAGAAVNVVVSRGKKPKRRRR
ncbi:MAG TPA: PASTA domain-containing protein [Solirubrobacteraceae bacterium]|nr:PASTA domain-containing protein [Solirubrobacteraceae bacterium]